MYTYHTNHYIYFINRSPHLFHSRSHANFSYKGVTHQNDTFGYKFTHIRVKHFYICFSVLVLTSFACARYQTHLISEFIFSRHISSSSLKPNKLLSIIRIISHKNYRINDFIFLVEYFTIKNIRRKVLNNLMK